VIHVEITDSFEDALANAIELVMQETGLPLDQLKVAIAYAGAGAWSKYLITDETGNILGSCSDQWSSFIPIADTVSELQGIFEQAQLNCEAQDHTVHNAMCSAWVSKPMHPADLLGDDHPLIAQTPLD